MAKALAGASDSVHLSQSPGVTATVGGTREGVILSDEDYRTLQQFLARDPEAGDIIPGTGGFRKLRWADSRRRKGKRGGLRIIYYYYFGTDP